MTFSAKLSFRTSKHLEILDITKDVKTAVAGCGIKNGLVNIFISHTTAGLKINHAEPLLAQDILIALSRLAPQDISYNHDLFEQQQKGTPLEKSNGHAHVKNFLLETSQTIPLANGNLVLGDRQSVLLVECDGGRERKVTVTVVGDDA